MIPYFEEKNDFNKVTKSICFSSFISLNETFHIFSSPEPRRRGELIGWDWSLRPSVCARISGRASASGSGGHGFEPRPCHTKGVKMVPVATFVGAQHYKASTGFSSPNKYCTTNIATITKK